MTSGENPEYLREDLDLEFELTADEMEKLAEVGQ